MSRRQKIRNKIIAGAALAYLTIMLTMHLKGLL